MVLKDSLQLTSFHSFLTILLYTQLHPNNFLVHSCLLGPCICSPSARNPFPQHLIIHIYLRFYLNSSGSIIQLQHRSHNIKTASLIGFQDGMQHSLHPNFTHSLDGYSLLIIISQACTVKAVTKYLLKKMTMTISTISDFYP